MKKPLILIVCFCFYLVGFTQILSDIDEVTPFHENLAAIRKGSQWAFINKEGVKVIDFRNDFVIEKDKNLLNEAEDVLFPYPLFSDGRCLIKKLVDNVYLYGYIDANGKEVITPQYLNASNYNNGYAIIIKILKETIGYNEILKKDIISSKLEEFIIDTNGETVKYLENPRNYIPSKSKNSTPPDFHSKFISPHLIAVMKKDEKWDIYKF